MYKHLHELERKGTDCLKWDALEKRFGDPDLLAMWVADMDFAAPKSVLDALSDRVAHGAFGYSLIPEAWKNSIVKWERSQHLAFAKHEWIRFTNGVVPAVYWLIEMLTELGDSCLIQTPVYYPFHHAVRDTGRSLICNDLVNDNGKYSIDFDSFEDAIRVNKVKLFILCSPHNPVGRVWQESELKKLWGICQKYNVFVISDEVHRDLVFSPHRHVPTSLVADNTALLITLSSASKTFNLASLGNAFAIIPDPVLRSRFDAYVKRHCPGDGNILGFTATEAAYTTGSEWLCELLEVVKANAEYICKRLAGEFPQIVVTPLEGTYLLWIDMRAVIKADELSNFMRRKCRVAVDDGSWFGSAGDGFIRLNLATPLKRVAEVMNRIIHALHEQFNHSS